MSLYQGNLQYATTVVDPAEAILMEIKNHLSYMIDHSLPGKYIIQVLDRMVTEGKISYAGHGSNRKVIKINRPMTMVLNRVGFTNVNGGVVVKIPFNILGGGKDNLREEVAVEHIKKLALRPGVSQDIINLSRLLFECKIYDPEHGHILIEEEIVPIERTSLVTKLMERNPMQYNEHNIGDAVLEVVSNDSNLVNQMRQLMRGMDEAFVMSDLNILYSKFNFGFKNVNGKYYLTIIDLGTVLPKVFPNLVPVCPSCGKPLSYINIFEPFYNENEARKLRLQTRLISSGYYSCKSPDCTYNGTVGERDPYMVEDIMVFDKYRENVLNFLIQNPYMNIDQKIKNIFL